MAGFRGLLELFLWRARAPGEPPPPFDLLAPRALLLRAYHGEAGEYLEDWPEYSVVEIAFGPHGPDTARVEVPRTAPFLHHSRSLPGGVGAFVEIDAASFGVPDVWTGRLLAPQFDGDGAGVTLSLKGPEEWLSRIGVPLAGQSARPAADVVRDALAACPAETWVRVPSAGSGTHWSRVPFDLTGQALWPLMTGLAETRGEEFTLTARPRRVMFDLSWRHPLDATEADVTLEHGRNCTLSSSALNLGLPLQDAVGVALSYGAGDEVVGALVKAPASARLGLRDGLTAAMSALAVRKLAGTGSASEALPAPEVTSQAALEAMLEALLRREMVTTCTAQLQDVKPHLWPHLRPGTLIRVSMPDPFALFHYALARIRTATFRLAPDLACSLSVDLWAIEGASRAQ